MDTAKSRLAMLHRQLEVGSSSSEICWRGSVTVDKEGNDAQRIIHIIFIYLYIIIYIHICTYIYIGIVHKWRSEASTKPPPRSRF